MQFTCGGERAGSLRVRFDLFHTGRREDELATLEPVACDWVPGGATIFRKAVFDAMPYDTSLEAGSEDSDWSITARRAGLALGNAPLPTVIHRHLEFYRAEQREAHFGSQRYDKGELERTLIRFQEKHGLFLRLGGFDEVGLPASFSDVNFCLRARQEGLRILYIPFAEFPHVETATRGPELDPREVRLMERRWGHVLARDPYDHPGLTLSSETARPDPWRRAGVQAARAH